MPEDDAPEPFTLRPPTQWPLLLLGPMVRKVTSAKAFIFVATKEECSAQILIREGPHSYDAVPDGPVANQVVLHQLGLNLYVGLLEVDLPDPGADKVYSYDVQLQLLGAPTPGPLTRLNDLGLLGNPPLAGGVTLEGHAPLGYAPNMLPSFLTPPADPLQLRIAQASCRKPHGNPDSGYEPDALPILDEIIARAVFERQIEPADPSLAMKDFTGADVDAPAFPPPELTERPHQLILTGDQIYADDVAPALLDTILSVSEDLLGWHEALPGINEGVNGFLAQPGWRSRYLVLSGVKELASDLESDYDQSHLLRFGEWVTMYMMAWSPALWPRTSDESKITLREKKPRLPISEAIGLLDMAEWVSERLPMRAQRQTVQQTTRTLLPATVLMDYAAGVARNRMKVASKNEKTRNKIFAESREPAIQYGSTTVYVRRVLANTPTYMMFDDHEITDDWFVTRNVAERLLGYDPIGASTSAPSGPAASDPNGAVPPENFWGAHVGPRLLRNGLSAYAIFQHWGNVPEDFAGWQGLVESGPDAFDNWEQDGISIGARLLHLWRPAGIVPHPLAPPLAGPHVDPSVIRGVFWWSNNLVDAFVPEGTQDEWLSYSWAPHSATRAADDLLRIGAAPDASTGLIPVNGEPADRAAFKSFRWDYAIEFDSHRLIALDSRTWRRFPTDATTNPIPGVGIPTTTLMARDATASALLTYATVWLGVSDTACKNLGYIMEALAELLQTTYLNNPPAGEETFSTRSTNLSQDILLYVTGALTGSTRLVIPAIATFEAEVTQSEAATYTTRPPITDDKGYWLRAAAILKEVAHICRAHQDLSKPLAALGHYVDRLCAGSTKAAITALRDAIDLVANLAGLTGRSQPPAQGGYYLQPTPSDLDAIQAAQTDLVSALNNALSAVETYESSAQFFRDGSGYMAAELIRKDALDWMVTQPVQNLAPHKETVILSSAPIFGVAGVELLQRVAVMGATLSGVAGAEKHDFEAWSANPVGFDNLMIAAKALPRAIVLSGDVHYGFSSSNHVTIDREGVNTTYLQFCSSASKNSDLRTKSLGNYCYILFDNMAVGETAQFNGIGLLRNGMNLLPPAPSTYSATPSTAGSSESLFLQWLDDSIRDTLEKTAEAYHLDDLGLMRNELLGVRSPADYLRWYYRWFLDPGAKAIGRVFTDPQYVVGAYDYLTQAPVNHFVAFKDESLWSTFLLFKTFVAVVDDPAEAAFGHALYGRDVLNRMSIDLYRLLGLDASYGYHIRTTRLEDDQGYGRLAKYGARYRYSGAGKHESNMRYADIQGIHIVGSANVGLVRFVNSVEGGPGAVHHMLFYPDPSHPGMVTVPPGPLLSHKVKQPDIGEVKAYPHPRIDWMCTRHSGWFTGTVAPIGGLPYVLPAS